MRLCEKCESADRVWLSGTGARSWWLCATCRARFRAWFIATLPRTVRAMGQFS